jgi:hypothetical protein
MSHIYSKEGERAVFGTDVHGEDRKLCLLRKIKAPFSEATGLNRETICLSIVSLREGAPDKAKSVAKVSFKEGEVIDVRLLEAPLELCIMFNKADLIAPPITKQGIVSTALDKIKHTLRLG